MWCYSAGHRCGVEIHRSPLHAVDILIVKSYLSLNMQNNFQKATGFLEKLQVYFLVYKSDIDSWNTKNSVFTNIICIHMPLFRSQ